MHEWIVPSQHTGIKLLAFVTSQLNGLYSAKHLKRCIENNCCTINGRTERFATTLLGSGDRITLLLSKPLVGQTLSQVNSSSILYEDSDIFIYNKPQGINCDNDGILKLLKTHDSNLQLVHRLDRETTGALILVKNHATFLYFLDQFKHFRVKKSYKTIVDGSINRKQGTIENYLGRKKTFSGQSIWGAVKTGGLHALTIWKMLKVGKNATLLQCFPQTGRTHQIRVHMSEMHHPILGDFQYGKDFKCFYRPAHYLLHAEKISFLHPKTEQLVTVEAPLSEEFCKAQYSLFGMEI